MSQVENTSRRDDRNASLTRRLIAAMRCEGGRYDVRLLRSMRKRRRKLNRDQRSALERAEAEAAEPLRFVAHDDRMARPLARSNR